MRCVRVLALFKWFMNCVVFDASDIYLLMLVSGVGWFLTDFLYEKELAGMLLRGGPPLLEF